MLSSEYLNPPWLETGWQAQISTSVREAWSTFTPEQRKLLAENAQETVRSPELPVGTAEYNAFRRWLSSADEHVRVCALIETPYCQHGEALAVETMYWKVWQGARQTYWQEIKDNG